MKVARKLEEVAELYDSAVREAITAFGRGECYVERFLDRPRHVEAQIIADKYGNVLVLGTRDCSLQRRNQKLIEEAPAPFITDAQRHTIEDSAKRICAAAKYSSAGTVEFLLGQDGTISFLEVNTRLQVEHTVTEETTGVDIVIEQFRIAEGKALAFSEAPPRGHAIEFRINAEDPAKGFLPTPALITRFAPPSGPGVRLDSGVVSGSIIPGQYDSLIAKLIVTGKTRDEALARARRALSEFQIEGPATVLAFHQAVLSHPDFTGENGFNIHTSWIETDFHADLTQTPRPAPMEEHGLLRLPVEINGKRHQIGLPRAVLAGLSSAAPAIAATQTVPENAIKAPVAGSILAWKVADKAEVGQGDLIAVMEAMKMEVQITAPRPGTLRLQAAQGTFLNAGDSIADYE